MKDENTKLKAKEYIKEFPKKQTITGDIAVTSTTNLPHALFKLISFRCNEAGLF